MSTNQRPVGPQMPNQSQLERAASAIRDAHRTHARLAPPTRIVTSQRANQKLTALLTNAGLNVDAFEEIRAEHLTELRQRAERKHTDTIAQSSSARDVLHRDFASRRKLAEHLAALPAAQNYILDTPDLIGPTDAVFITATHYEPYNSWAKIKFDDGVDGDHPGREVSFYFRWENPLNNPIMITARALHGLNGVCELGQDGGLFSWGSKAQLFLFAYFGALQWWLNPPEFAPQGANSHLNVLSHIVAGGGFSDPGEIDLVNVHTAYTLSYDLPMDALMLPPGGVMVFEVTLNIGYSLSNGYISVDFASGAFEIMCPMVQITIHP